MKELRLGCLIMAVIILSLLASCSDAAKTDAEWEALTLSRAHMNAAKCFYFYISENEKGQLTVTGYFTDENGNEYSAKNGIILSDEVAEDLRTMNLEGLPDKKKKLFSIFKADDETVRKLNLSYKNGIKKEKNISDKEIEMILSLITEDIFNNNVNN